MIRIACINFYWLVRKNFPLFLLSCVCMTVAFIAFLFIQERGYEIYKENVKNDQQSKTLYVSCDDKHSIMDISELFINNATLPRVKVATVSDSKYTGIFWLDEYAEICYTPYGRRFTAQEMLSGAPVALLGTGYISQLDNESIDSIWDNGININGTKLHTIGNYSFHWSAGSVPDEDFEYEIMHTSITIPMKTFFALGLAPVRLRCVFEESLTDKQVVYLTSLLNSFNSIRTILLPISRDFSAIKNYIEYINAITPYSFGILLSSLSIISVLFSLLKHDMVRYHIYLICGANRKHIISLLSTHVFFILTITYSLACCALYMIALLTPDGILSALPLGAYFLVYFCALLLVTLLINIRVIPLLFQNEDF